MRIPAPPEEYDENAFDDWTHAHIRSFTGSAMNDGDSWYDVTAAACSDRPYSDRSLPGREFDFGY